MSYTPQKGRTTKELEHYLSVCRKNGYHCAFPYGWSLASPHEDLYEILRHPVYHGWTLRVFFYAVNQRNVTLGPALVVKKLRYLFKDLVAGVSNHSVGYSIRTRGRVPVGGLGRRENLFLRDLRV
ncbi:hypothetical protein MTO96_014166 [Rhipicephalus appendiculatus]